MITLDDCVALCGLSNDEVSALAEHEHIPEMTAAALGQCLLSRPGGCQIIRDMIADDMRWARQRGDEKHADELALALKQFVSSHSLRIEHRPPINVVSIQLIVRSYGLEGRARTLD